MAALLVDEFEVVATWDYKIIGGVGFIFSVTLMRRYSSLAA